MGGAALFVSIHCISFTLAVYLRDLRQFSFHTSFDKIAQQHPPPHAQQHYSVLTSIVKADRRHKIINEPKINLDGRERFSSDVCVYRKYEKASPLKEPISCWSVRVCVGVCSVVSDEQYIDAAPSLVFDSTGL